MIRLIFGVGILDSSCWHCHPKEVFVDSENKTSYLLLLLLIFHMVGLHWKRMWHIPLKENWDIFWERISKSLPTTSKLFMRQGNYVKEIVVIRDVPVFDVSKWNKGVWMVSWLVHRPRIICIELTCLFTKNKIRFPKYLFPNSITHIYNMKRGHNILTALDTHLLR